MYINTSSADHLIMFEIKLMTSGSMVSVLGNTIKQDSIDLQAWMIMLRFSWYVYFKQAITFLNKGNNCTPNFHLGRYEGCSNMNTSSFIAFFIYVLQQNVMLFWKELFVAVKMASNIKKHSLYFSSYRPLYKGHSCILNFFWRKLQCTFCYMCG